MPCMPFSEIGTRALPTSLQTCLAGIPIRIPILASTKLGKEYFACDIPSPTLPTNLVLLLACKTSYYLLQHRKEDFKFFPCIYSDLPSQNVSSKIIELNLPFAKDPNLIRKGTSTFVSSQNLKSSFKSFKEYCFRALLRFPSQSHWALELKQSLKRCSLQ